MRLFLSRDSLLDTSYYSDDREIGELWVPELAPGQCSIMEEPLGSVQNLPSDGLYTLIAKLDNGDGGCWYSPDCDLNPTNNTFVGGTIGVGYGVDLVIKDVQGPSSLHANQDATFSYEICNAGNDPSSPGTMHLFLSRDSQLDTSSYSDDREIGELWVPELAPGQCSIMEEPLGSVQNLPYEGLYTLIATLDNDADLNPTNNTFIGGTIGVGYGVDLVIKDVQGPSSLHSDQEATFSYEICNAGNDQSYSGSMRLFLSRDSQLDTSYYSDDREIGELWVPELAPGQCSIMEEPLGSVQNLPYDGQYTLIARLDNGDDLNPTNNTFIGGTVSIGAE
jgi:hypothetical protein